MRYCHNDNQCRNNNLRHSAGVVAGIPERIVVIAPSCRDPLTAAEVQPVHGSVAGPAVPGAAAPNDL